jgi:hypothetical protein
LKGVLLGVNKWDAGCTLSFTSVVLVMLVTLLCYIAKSCQPVVAASMSLITR